MKCTDREQERIREIDRKRARARRRKKNRRKKRIRRFFTFVFFVCLLSAVGFAFFCYAKNHQTKVKKHELTAYNRNVYTGALYSDGICVAPLDVMTDLAPEQKEITSGGLFDITNAQTVYAYNVHKKLYPASLTKLMTALVAFKNTDLNEMVTVSANADKGKFAADERTCGLREGDQLTMKDLLYGLLLHSGNDNAVAIADHIAGSEARFAEMMNAEAKTIMATGSHFVNASGLHDKDHYTTVYDLYLIFANCMKYKEFSEILGAGTYTASFTNKNNAPKSLTFTPSNLYASGDVTNPTKVKVIGGKTGTTLKAGNCLIILDETASRTQYVSVIMGAESREILYKNMNILLQDIEKQ